MFKRNFTDSQLMEYLKNEKVIDNCKKVNSLPVNEYWRNSQLVAVTVINGKDAPACVYTYNQK